MRHVGDRHVIGGEVTRCAARHVNRDRRAVDVSRALETDPEWSVPIERSAESVDHLSDVDLGERVGVGGNGIGRRASSGQRVYLPARLGERGEDYEIGRFREMVRTE